MTLPAAARQLHPHDGAARRLQPAGELDAAPPGRPADGHARRRGPPAARAARVYDRPVGRGLAPSPKFQAQIQFTKPKRWSQNPEMGTVLPLG